MVTTGTEFDQQGESLYRLWVQGIQGVDAVSPIIIL